MTLESSPRWHVVCRTFEDWETLAEWFRDSTVKCEKELYKCLSVDFLPAIPEIIEAKVSQIVNIFYTDILPLLSSDGDMQRCQPFRFWRSYSDFNG